MARILEDQRHEAPPRHHVAPIDGTVVFRHAVSGEAVEPTTQLFTVADTSTMWLWIDVYERDIAEGRAGPDGDLHRLGDGPERGRRRLRGQGHLGRHRGRRDDPDDRRSGPSSRTPTGKLRANQFGKAEIQVGEPHKALIVPKAAVQRNENVDLVFLPEKAGRLPAAAGQDEAHRPRATSLEVTWGLKPGQGVVTDGAFLLKTEIMKGAIGAGCCD